MNKFLLIFSIIIFMAIPVMAVPSETEQVRPKVKCARKVQEQAKFSHKWINGWLEDKLHFYMSNKETGVDIYFGNKVKFQNGYGAWLRYAYKCYWDKTNEPVLSVDLAIYE